MLVGAVGIELKAMLKMRKLLILLNGKNARSTRFAQVRYTAGTRGIDEICLWRLTGLVGGADGPRKSPVAIRNFRNFNRNVLQTPMHEETSHRNSRAPLVWRRADDHLMETKSQTFVS